MKIKALCWQVPLSIGMAVAGVQAASAAGYVTLSASGKTVLAACNPNNVAAETGCQVTSLPGEPGYDLVASRSAPLIYNDVTIGTVAERVWRSCTDKTLYIFGTRLTMNKNQWDSSGAAFNVNDVFRQSLPKQAVAIAYYLDGATKALKKSGRTVQGLNEFDGAQPERDNTWVDFRIDANAAELSGPSSPKSPWVLTKMKAPTGYAINPLGLRVFNSDVADFTDAVDFYTSSYQPNGVPPPVDDGD